MISSNNYVFPTDVLRVFFYVEEQSIDILMQIHLITKGLHALAF